MKTNEWIRLLVEAVGALLIIGVLFVVNPLLGTGILGLALLVFANTYLERKDDPHDRS